MNTGHWVPNIMVLTPHRCLCAKSGGTGHGLREMSYHALLYGHFYGLPIKHTYQVNITPGYFTATEVNESTPLHKNIDSTLMGRADQETKAQAKPNYSHTLQAFPAGWGFNLRLGIDFGFLWHPSFQFILMAHPDSLKQSGLLCMCLSIPQSPKTRKCTWGISVPIFPPGFCPS